MQVQEFWSMFGYGAVFFIITGCSNSLSVDENVVNCRPLAVASLIKPNSNLSPSAVDFFVGKALISEKAMNNPNSFPENAFLLLGDKACKGLLDKEHIEFVFSQSDFIDDVGARSIFQIETVLENAVQKNDWKTVKQILSKLELNDKKNPHYSSIKNIKPTENLRFLKNTTDASTYNLLSIKNYYDGLLALNEANIIEASDALLSLLALNTNYSYLPRPLHISISHNNSDYYQSSIVMNSIYLMDLSLRLSKLEEDHELSLEQAFKLYVLGVRQLAFSLTGGAIETPYKETLSHFNLLKYKERLKANLVETSNLSSVSTSAFTVGYSKFRLNWPFDRGPYLWRYVSQLNMKFNALHSKPKDICVAEILQYSFNMQKQDLCRPVRYNK